MATYEFRDPTGRLVGQPTAMTAHAPATGATDPSSDSVREGSTEPSTVLLNGQKDARPAGPGAAAPPGTSSGDRLSSRSASPRPSDVPTQTADGSTPDEQDLDWTTDPMTGMRVPAFFVSG
jgi:hypothetical protein